ncbi:hypothetical protein Kpho01_75760 [Kitasatospora phosalacinea]|uniref:Uncharacterized protein n=1 Tax=Kitasatospora phosalacinea TaxID=2065 RepID=A0A9W6PRG4_9ACTN|nr:hypothetical protein Kpho01_75760 [Kitasatospora phosalacinea]
MRRAAPGPLGMFDRWVLTVFSDRCRTRAVSRAGRPSANGGEPGRAAGLTAGHCCWLRTAHRAAWVRSATSSFIRMFDT